MNRLAVACVAGCALAACSTPDLKIIYEVADGTTGATCGTADCQQVPMACDSVLHLRILRPSDPNAPLVSICQDVQPDAARDLCAIGQIDLPQEQLPRETLEVQVTVWPRTAVLADDGISLDCGKIPVEFDATYGFPVAGGVTQQAPAFGGRAFYHPGDNETVVTLGCTDLASVNDDTCAGAGAVDVTATVADFENLPFNVSPTVADRLTVSVGEPSPFEDHFQLLSADLANLPRTVPGPIPVWEANVDTVFESTACVVVEEQGAQTTSTLRCREASPDATTLDLPGLRLPKVTLGQILTSLSLPAFPEQGMTVGIVLDHLGNPAPGFAVSATAGTVEYLNDTRNGLTTGQTSMSGIFVSRDAPYHTFFSAFGPQPVTGIGGLVDGYVTMVVLQFDQPIGG